MLIEKQVVVFESISRPTSKLESMPDHNRKSKYHFWNGIPTGVRDQARYV